MLKTFVCGTGNFPQNEEEDDPSSLTTPRRVRTCKLNNLHHNHHDHNKSKFKKNKNPYSNRGLDKFTTLLAELDERRRKIYQQIGSPDESLVRFGYSSSRDWVPIVVKLKEEERENKAELLKEKEKPTPSLSPPPTVNMVQSQVDNKTKKKSLVFSMVRWRTPHLCLLVVITMILVSLLISGKSFAIICTSIWWYMMPTMKQNEMNWRRKTTMKKKVYGRFLSDKKIVTSGNPSKAPVVVKCLNRGYSNKGW